MAIVPGGFDEHPSQVGIPGFSNRAAGLPGAARMFRRYQADKRHRARRSRESPRIAEFGGDGQRREVIETRGHIGGRRHRRVGIPVVRHERLDPPVERHEAPSMAERESQRVSVSDLTIAEHLVQRDEGRGGKPEIVPPD